MDVPADLHIHIVIKQVFSCQGTNYLFCLQFLQFVSKFVMSEFVLYSDMTNLTQIAMIGYNNCL